MTSRVKTDRRLATATSARVKTEDGQATVELVAFLPLVLIATLAGAALIAGHAAAEQAGEAAEAGAVALLQGGDPRAAARRALAPHTHATIDVHGRRVTVHVRPDLPITALERPLTGDATADAGREPMP
jgi:hypothetical protein